LRATRHCRRARQNQPATAQPVEHLAVHICSLPLLRFWAPSRVESSHTSQSDCKIVHLRIVEMPPVGFQNASFIAPNSALTRYYSEAPLAQLVEHALRKRMVVGSIPTGADRARFGFRPRDVRCLTVARTIGCPNIAVCIEMAPQYGTVRRFSDCPSLHSSKPGRARCIFRPQERALESKQTARDTPQFILCAPGVHECSTSELARLDKLRIRTAAGLSSPVPSWPRWSS
jgi:hypothetical protein